MNSAFNQWDYSSVVDSWSYGDPKLYELGAAYLQGNAQVEDWGCGPGFFKTVMARYNPMCRVVNIDGSPSRFTDLHLDLVDYRSQTPAIFMRGVLEHNPDQHWQKILRNACQSFEKQMILILFTPFADKTYDIYAATSGGTNKYIGWAFRRADITDILDEQQLAYTIETFHTDTEFNIEHLFNITRPRAD